jgi:BirA family biotin operon repressor/biotin-[acetyl-CoA-carboxylase] ligase
MSARDRHADAVLKQLRGAPQSPARLASVLGISADEVQGAFRALEDRGYEITRDPGPVARLSEIPDLLLPDELEHELGRCRLGTPLHTYGSVGSTNTVAQRLADSGAPEGTLVTAEEQTRGRGRLGRTWHSPPGVGVWMSLVLRPAIDPGRAAALSLLAGLAIVAALQPRSRAPLLIKWPNDVLLEGRKLAGILCESAVEGTKLRHTVVGVGINVNQGSDQMPADIRTSAVSLRMANGQFHRRVEIVAEILREFEARYDAYVGGRSGELIAEFREKSGLIGRSVRVAQDHRTHEGTVLDVTPEGSLLVLTGSGPQTVTAGDASLRME